MPKLYKALRNFYFQNSEKIFRIIIFSVLFTLLLRAGYTCFYQYIDKPTYTATKIQPQHDGKFPAFSICPLNSGYKPEILKKNGISDKNCYNSLTRCNIGQPDWTGNDSTISPRELFNYSIIDVDDVVNFIYVKFLYSHDKYNMTKTLKGNDLMNLTKSPSRFYGYCFTYYPEESFRKAGIYYIKISVKLPAKIHIHDKSQFLAFNGRLGHNIRLGEKTYVSLNIHEIEQIQRINEHAHLPDSTFEHRYSCSLEPYDACIFDRISKAMISHTEDNCTAPWYPPHDLSNGKICSKEDDIRAAFTIHTERITNQRKDCNDPCRVLILNQSGRNYQERNETWDHGLIFFYFSATSFKSTDHFLYPIEILIAEFGGYMGLLLGLSILDIAFKLIDVFGQLSIHKNL